MFRTIKYQLYLLQLENYNLSRYWKIVIKKIFSRGVPRQKIVWTPKLGTVFAIAIFLQILVSYLVARPLASDDVYLAFFPLVFLFSFLLLCFFHFIFLVAAVLILWPVDQAVKNYIVTQAKAKIGQLTHDRGLVVIGITGSYGKTTMKEILATILAEKFPVLKTPDSVNTPIGISRLILKDLEHGTKIFIVEMGAYQIGDIQALCEIVPPDIAVLTGINEAHLERFGSIENTIEGKFEIVKNMKEGGFVLLNNDDQRIKDNYKRFVGSKRVQFYSSFTTASQPLPLLGQYVHGVINASTIVAKELGMTDEEIARGERAIKPVPHRLELIENPATGISVIDDSYNGNPDGVREAIKALARFEGRRKIYLTPGLVEAGDRAKDIHNEIGRQLRDVADLVILIKNSVTPYIAEKLDPEKIYWFSSALEAHAALSSILQKGDVILFQNDWPDNYI